MVENNLKRILNYLIIKVKSFFLSKNVLIFMIFLFLSTVFWYFHALDKERETTITVPVKFSGLHANYNISNRPPDNIKITIKDEGLNLIGYPDKETAPITIDLSNVDFKKGKFMVTGEMLYNKALRYRKLLPSSKIMEIRPDSILLEFEKLSSVQVPVKVNMNYTIENQYIQSSPMTVVPEYVQAYGSKPVIRDIKQVSTVPVKEEGLNDTVTFTFKLQQTKGVHYSTDAVKVKFFIEKFTEKKFSVPVKVINCPDNFFVRTFPAVVDVTCNVGLSHFEELLPDDVQVVVDYNDLKNSDQNKERLKVVNRVVYVSNVRIVPDEVEYILENK